MEKKFLYKTFFFVNLVYSPPKENIVEITAQINRVNAITQNNLKLKQQIEKLNQDITNLKSQLYISENRFNDKNKDHERIVKDKDAEIAKLKKKSWAAKASPFLACTLSLILIFVVMRIYFTLYPFRD